MLQANKINFSSFMEKSHLLREYRVGYRNKRVGKLESTPLIWGYRYASWLSNNSDIAEHNWPSVLPVVHSALRVGASTWRRSAGSSEGWYLKLEKCPQL